MNIEYWQRIKDAIPVNSHVRCKWNGLYVEGLVVGYENIDECDMEDVDWPEDAECADLLWVCMFHVIDVWWFDIEEAEVRVNETWRRADDVILSHAMKSPLLLIGNAP